MCKSKCAIVTGGSRGIGRGIVFALARDGYDVAFSYNSREDEAKTLAGIIEEKYGTRVFYTQAKLEMPGAGTAFFHQAAEFLGGLDLLVNNAGATVMEKLTEITDETLDFLISLNFRNYIVLMREASQYMISHGIKGSIVNITSSRGERAYPGDGIYGGLKAGLNRAIQSFALDVAKKGIRINNVAPGAIRIRKKEEILESFHGTVPESHYDELGRRIPLGRVGEPEDIAKAVLFLASEDASYITGITLRIDGGLILPGMPETRKDAGWSEENLA